MRWGRELDGQLDFTKEVMATSVEKGVVDEGEGPQCLAGKVIRDAGRRSDNVDLGEAWQR